MAADQDRLEMERLTNLVSGFGWKVRKQEFEDDKLVVILEKSRGPGVEIPEAGAG